MNWKQTLMSILGILTLWMVSTAIFNFFGVSFEQYGNYLFWSIALVLFTYVLDRRGPSLFL